MEITIKSVQFAIMAALLALPILFIQPADAYQTCLNGTWLSTYYDVQVSGSNIPVNITERCQYGCDLKEAQCNPSEFQTYAGPLGNIGIMGLFLVIIIAALAIWRFA